MVEGHRWRQKQRRYEVLSLAWYTAALVRADKLPPLDKFLDPTVKPVTREEFDELQRKFGVPKKG